MGEATANAGWLGWLTGKGEEKDLACSRSSCEKKKLKDSWRQLSREDFEKKEAGFM